MNRDFVRVCRVDEVKAARLLEQSVAPDTKVLLVWVDDSVRAFQAHCPHQDVALANGIFDGAVLTCHEHLWQFDARTGKGLDPDDSCLGCFDVRIENEEVWVSRMPISRGSAGASGDPAS